MRVCLALSLMLIALLPAAQGQSLDAPDSASRGSDSLLRRLAISFDFNERERGNFTDMPLHWNRVGGDGFPGHTDIQFDEQVRHLDQGLSFRLALNGGNAAAELKSGVLAAIPETDYLLEGYLRTEDAQVARARVVGLYLDANNREIERHQTLPMVSANRWAMFRLDLRRAPREAAWIALRLELLQPERYRDPEPKPLAQHALNPQDLHAKAWFDDLAIYRMPRIEISVQHPSGLIRAPQQPVLRLVAQDPLGESRQAEVRLWDHRGVEVAHDRRALNATNRHPWEWKPDLSGYGYGWYRAELWLYSATGMRVRRSTSFAWLPPADRTAEADRFALIAEGLNPTAHDHIEDLLAPLSPQTLVVDAWRNTDTLESLVDASTAERNPIGLLLNRGQRVVLSLGGIPTTLSHQAGVDPHRPMDLFLREPEIWQPWLQTLLSRYGHRVNEWMMGSASGEVATDQQQLATAYTQAHPFSTLCDRTIADSALVGTPSHQRGAARYRLHDEDACFGTTWPDSRLCQRLV